MKVVKTQDGDLLNLEQVKRFSVNSRMAEPRWRIMADDEVMFYGFRTKEEAQEHLDALFDYLMKV